VYKSKMLTYGVTTKAEFDIAWGRHSLIPECCILAFVEGGENGPCEKCGGPESQWEHKLHICDWDSPECVPFLRYCTDRYLANTREMLERGEARTIQFHQEHFWTDQRHLDLYAEFGFTVTTRIRGDEKTYVCTSPKV
jgi:hypothetical protein